MSNYVQSPDEGHTPEHDELIKTVNVLIDKGDKAKAKADEFYIAAGQHLKTLKEKYGVSWAKWESLLKDKIKLSTGRASELMQIADGRKTIAEVRSGKAESMKKARSSSPRGEDPTSKTAGITLGKPRLAPGVRQALREGSLEGCEAALAAVNSVPKDQQLSKVAELVADRVPLQTVCGIPLPMSAPRIVFGATDDVDASFGATDDVEASAEARKREAEIEADEVIAAIELRATLGEIGPAITDQVDTDANIFWCHFSESPCFKMWEAGTPAHRSAFLKMLTRDARDRKAMAEHVEPEAAPLQPSVEAVEPISNDYPEMPTFLER